jgi:uncharacterized membrane-anchored protein YhcB (DUF1043 family)
MKEEEKFLEKAVETIKNEPAGSNPPQEVIDATLAKLAESSDESHPKTQKLFVRPKFTHNLTKIAAAAVLFISIGYAAARFTTPRPPDIEQIRAALEPNIRENLLNETKQYLQLGLANCYVQLKDDLHQQYRQDLSQVAAQTLALSNSATNQLLEQLIEAINEAQTQDRQWFTSAIGEVELNRRRDKAQLSNALVNFATQTEDELQRTQQGLAQLLSYTQPDNSTQNESQNTNNLN